MTDPLYTAGLSIETNYHDGPGTIGGFAQDAAGHPVLLSCSHVLFPNFVALSNGRVYSPDYSSTCCGGDPIAQPVFDPTKAATADGAGGWSGGFHDGTWTGGFNWVSTPGLPPNIPADHASETDCAMARLDPGIRYQNTWQITQNGTTTTIPLKGAASGGLGVVKGPALGTAPTAQQYVRVYSAIHQTLQYATVLSFASAPPHTGDPDNLLYRYSISDPGDAMAGAKPAVNQFLILPRPTPKGSVSYVDSYRTGESLNFHGGESGSFVINDQNLVIGMLIAIVFPQRVGVPTNSMELRDVRSLGVVTPIAPILANLNVTIPAANDGWSGTVPAAAPSRVRGHRPAADAGPRRRQVAVRRLREQLGDSVRGRLLLGKVGQHRREVRRLLTTVRPIAVAWQRLGGPAYYHHCLRSVELAGHRIPTNINGVGREQLVTAMLELFHRYGSDGLRLDIDRYRRLFVTALADIVSIMDVPDALARTPARLSRTETRV